jgi:hypothetical protein
MPVMAEVATFCRARQAVCHHAVPVPQVAMLYSTAAHYREINGLFSRDLSRLQGTLQALLEGQHSVEVLGEHHLSGRMAEYPLLVVPECDYVESTFKDELIDYVKGGGSLLVIGPQAAAMFQTELGVTLEGQVQSEPRYLACSGELVPTRGQTQTASLGPKAQPFGRLHAGPDANSPSQPAASITPLGRGRIAATYFAFSQGYLNGRSAAARAFLNDLAGQLFPRPLVEVKGSPDVDVAVNRLGGKLAVNLVNTTGPHANTQDPIIDTIPPIGPLNITIRVENKPSRITLEPGSRPLPFDHRDGQVRLTLPRLDIHEVILVE